jgi:hypothetical protein
MSNLPLRLPQPQHISFPCCQVGGLAWSFVLKVWVLRNTQLVSQVTAKLLSCCPPRNAPNLGI